jgi:hypothetical protein
MLRFAGPVDQEFLVLRFEPVEEVQIVVGVLRFKWSGPDPLRNSNRDIFCLYS